MEDTQTESGAHSTLEFVESQIAQARSLIKEYEENWLAKERKRLAELERLRDILMGQSNS